MSLGMVALALAPLLFTGALADGERPAALVFENALYQQRLADTGIGALMDLVDCSALGSCNPPAADVANRVVAYVAALPRNLSGLAELPKLKLYQSAWYLTPLGGFPAYGVPFASPAAVPPEVTVAMWVNYSLYGQFAQAMADWVAASMFRWNFRLHDKETAFRNCAWAADAPLSCPPMTSMTGQVSLRGMTFGIIGYGNIGKAQAEVMSSLGMRVVASKHSGPPFTPTPPGLAWLSGDNDRVWRESDFVLVSVPFSVSVVNRTSLSLMKPTAVLINVNPMPDAELDALYEALSSRSIGGAFIDAWSQGCLSVPMQCGPPFGESAWPTSAANQRFLELDNVQITGFNMDQDDAFWALSAKGVGANLQALVFGGELSNLVRNGTSIAASVAGAGLESHTALVEEPQSQKSQALDLIAAFDTALQEEPQTQKTQHVAGGTSSAWIFQQGFFGVACFAVGAIFGARGLSPARSGSGIAVEASGPMRADYAQMEP